jgi:hypothetical protein
MTLPIGFRGFCRCCGQIDQPDAALRHFLFDEDAGRTYSWAFQPGTERQAVDDMMHFAKHHAESSTQPDGGLVIVTLTAFGLRPKTTAEVLRHVQA